MSIELAPLAHSIYGVGVCGDFDYRSRSEFLEAVAHQARGGKDVDVDLSEVELLDSSGVSALVVAVNVLHEQGHAFYIAAMSSTVADMLTRTGLFERFHRRGLS